MLVELGCSAFASSGKSQGTDKIKFHSGLNMVCGGESGDNSIGKTTFLKVVNFAFGSEDYPTEDVRRQVGEHVVEFAFEFSGERFRFRRETEDPGAVWKCDEQYRPTEKMPLDDYRSFLSGKYGMDSLGLSLREHLGGFLRIYDGKRRLHQDPLIIVGDNQEKTLVRLMKIFGEYGAIESAVSAKNLAKRRKTAYKAAETHQFVQKTTKSQKKQNEKRIVELIDEIKKLEIEFGSELSSVSAKTEGLSTELKNKLARLMRKRNNLKTNFELLNQNANGMTTHLKGAIEELKEFFPDADVRKIREIEDFHLGLKEILKPSVDQVRKDVASQLESVEAEIGRLNFELKGTRQDDGPSRTILRLYAEKTQEIERLKAANGAFDMAQGIDKDYKTARLECDKAFDEAGKKVEAEINAELRSSNASICGDQISVPGFSIRNGAHYEFKNAKDEGAGATDRGILQFHLAVLRLTKLPILVEDSDNFKTIEDRYVLKLLELFAREEKQIFVALDRAGHYSDDGNVPSVISDNAVLNLSKGNELFGRAWNVEE